MSYVRKRKRLNQELENENEVDYNIIIKNKVDLLEKQNLYLLQEIQKLKAQVNINQKNNNKVNKKVNKIQDKIQDRISQLDLEEFKMRMNFLENTIQQVCNILNSNKENNTNFNNYSYIN